MESVFSAESASAQGFQGNIDTVLSREREQREKEALRERLEQQESRARQRVLKGEQPSPADKLPPEAHKKVIDLAEVITPDSEILTRDEINQIVTPYIGRMVSLADLYEMIAVFDALYKEKGFATAKAMLPPQRIADGTVKIDLIEARIGAVAFEGAKHTRDSYFEQRLSFEPGDLVDVGKAEPALIRYNRLSDTRVHLTLKPGELPGTTDYTFKVQEPQQYRLDFGVDNYGQDRTGRERLSLDASIASVWGVRDRLAFGGSRSLDDIGGNGVRSVYLSYLVPLNSAGTTASISADRGESEILIPAAFGDGGALAEGGSFSATVNLGHPVYVDPEWLVRTYGAATWRESDLEFLDRDDFLLPKTKTVSGELGLYVEKLDRSGIWSSSHTVRYIHDRSDTDGPNGEDESFFKYQGRISRNQNLLPGMQLLLNVSGQVSSSENVVAAEQFQIGGAFTVRGFQESNALGDDGYLVSVQVNTLVPPFSAPRPGGFVQGFVFLDHGGVKVGREADHLTSVGTGLSIFWGDLMRQEWTIGFPVDDREDADDFEFHFSVNLSVPLDRLLDKLRG